MKLVEPKNFFAGIWKENPIFVLMLGLCPLLAVSSSLKDAAGMGVAFIAVLTGSNITVSLIRKVVPAHIRIPVFIVVIATFVTIVDYSLAAYLPQLHKNLGVYLPLMVVNCILLGRAEAFASKNNIFNSALDGLGMGLGFTLAIIVIAVLRELPGQGTLFGIRVFSENYKPFLIMIMPPGAFFVIGFLIALKNRTGGRKKC
ncbi:MAG: electron transport complex subunit E [Elusimicrobia bacterium]|jgi:electron transport complex protein RnfE|nr:electron transport complex subunit E [Elusimicrobiota bacterium]